MVGRDWGAFADLLPWLREACTRLLKTPGTADESLLGELRKAPVLLDVGYGALSLGALEEELRARGHISMSRVSCPGVHTPGRVAWPLTRTHETSSTATSAPNCAISRPWSSRLRASHKSTLTA